MSLEPWIIGQLEEERRRREEEDEESRRHRIELPQTRAPSAQRSDTSSEGAPEPAEPGSRVQIVDISPMETNVIAV